MQRTKYYILVITVTPQYLLLKINIVNRLQSEVNFIKYCTDLATG